MRKRNGMLRFVYLFALILTIAVVINVFLVAVGKIHIRSMTRLDPYVNSVSMIRETLYGERGYVYDSDGQVVAQNVKTYDIICYLSKDRISSKNEPAYVDDPLYTSQVLAQILNGDQTEIFSLLTSNPNLYQTELGTIGRNLSQETVDRILADKNLHGIGFKESTKRVYPLGQNFSPYLIGFARSDENGKLVGKMGLEIYLDEELAGENGMHIYQADKNGYILPGMYEETIPAKNGASVYLTLNSSVNEALQTAFNGMAEINGAVEAWGAVMDIHTGKLLGYGQYPSFDPNLGDIEDYNNYGSQWTYEPGSVLKSIIYSAAIDTGVYDGHAYFDSSPFCYYANGTEPYRSYGSSYGCIYNANHKSWGSIELDYGLIYSANVATSTLLTDYVGSRTFEEYLNAFGFFKPVDTDGIPENPGKKNFYYPSEKLALTYGQGSSVNMLQLLQAYSAIFGNGEMVKPYFIDRVVDENGEVIYRGERTVVGRPIKESTAKQMQELLARVVTDEGGTAKWYGIDEVNIMAKTGSGEIAWEGSYGSEYAIISVMQAFPAEDPQIMIYFAYIAPYDYQIHTRSAPIQELTKKVYILTTNQRREHKEGYYTAEKTEMQDLTGMTPDNAQAIVEDSGAVPYLIGTGTKIIDQWPKPGDDLYGGEKVFLLTRTNEFTVEDFTGWTRKEIVNYWQLSGLPITIDGYGVVVSQSVEPGTVVNSKQPITVVLQDIHTEKPAPAEDEEYAEEYDYSEDEEYWDDEE
ncbi:MAG: penicillin-binding protein [Erysipelotrichaceae bacterium]|nr:penicillin-binding protein [Erysipelotrichaceae bacterium]